MLMFFVGFGRGKDRKMLWTFGEFAFIWNIWTEEFYNI